MNTIFSIVDSAWAKIPTKLSSLNDIHRELGDIHLGEEREALPFGRLKAVKEIETTSNTRTVTLMAVDMTKN